MMFQPCFLAVEKKRADDRKVGCAFERSKAAGDFLAELHHAPVAFGLIVGEGNGRIVKEAQCVFFACCEAQEEIVSGSARRRATSIAGSLHGGARQRRSPSARMAS